MKIRKYEILRDAVRIYPYKGKPLDMPFAKMQPRPTRANPINWDGWDPDIGRNGVAYTLADGSEGAVLCDHVLSANNDPDYVARSQAHRLRVKLQAMLREQAEDTSVRSMAVKLGTSTSQVVRMLDRKGNPTLDSLVGALAKSGVRLDIKAS